MLPLLCLRDIRKVIQRVRFKKNLKKSTLAFKEGGGETQRTINFDGSYILPCLSFFPSGSTAATYIVTATTCTATIISLEPCALIAEIQHFVLSSSISY